MVCLLEGIQEQFFWTETTLQKCGKQNEYCYVIHNHSWSSFLHIKHARDLWPRRNQGDDASLNRPRKQLEAELEKSCCSLGGIRCLYTAVLVSLVQSIVQVLQRPLGPAKGLGMWLVLQRPPNTLATLKEFSRFNTNESNFILRLWVHVHE